eukprot:3109599-Karenia_brevis.AAC.1
MPVCVFTDGAFEGELATCGAVLVDQGLMEGFGIKIPDLLVLQWRLDGRKQVIGQAELWPVLVSKLTWKDRLAGRRVLFFIDNDSARFALIKQYSPVVQSAEILWKMAEVDAELRCWPWYARVASDSNPADAPSRLNFEWLRGAGGKIVDPVLPK